MSNVSEKSADNAAAPPPAIVAALREAGRIVVTTHGRMDGDAMGAAAAFCRSARAAGKDCRIVLLDPAPAKYAFLIEGLSPAGADEFAALAAEADRVVVLDTCALAQLEPIADQLQAVRDKVIVIDHHLTGDDVGAIVWRDTSAAAAGLMLAELLAELDWPVDAAAAEALAAAILTDTGWLRHSNTDARSLRAMADLVATGVEPNTLYEKLYQTDRPERLALLARALGSLALHADGRLAVMQLSAEDFVATGAGQDETEDFVNEPLRIAGVEVSVFLVASEGVTRVSLRSRRFVDVAALAKTFGGGGHARAAGLKSQDPIAALAPRLIAAVAQALDQVGR